MRQRIRKKQSKHGNSRVTRSKRTKRRTGKKRRVSVTGGDLFSKKANINSCLNTKTMRRK